MLIDDRRDYGETRYRAFGQLGERMHVLVFTQAARGIRVISLRRTNKQFWRWRRSELSQSREAIVATAQINSRSPDSP